MFFEPETLIVVYKDEMLANQLKKLVETKDDNEGVVKGTKDGSVNIITWTEKVWLANKKAGNITSKVLFLGDIKGTETLIPVLDVKFEKYGVRFGWAGNQAVLFVNPNEAKSIEEYYAFYTELTSLPVPQLIKDVVKPKLKKKELIKEETVSETDTVESNENSVMLKEDGKDNKFVDILQKGKNFALKAGNAIGDVVSEVDAKRVVFAEENLKNKSAIMRQQLFYGVIKLYEDGLEEFINL